MSGLPTMPLADAERIAAKLGDGQRAAVRVLSDTFKTPPRGHAYWASTLVYGDRLTTWRYENAATGNKRLYALTPLGLQVRAILQGQSA